ncbi:MAG: hypothetical protein CME06_04470 [Gemmatimonadetes bacterium]|nr:hypothetical protein [Gemmatimonadota bacterium]
MGAASAVMMATIVGLPVSTTHVSTGALFGLGASTGGLRRRTMAKILAAWAVTLPAAGAAAWGGAS